MGRASQHDVLPALRQAREIVLQHLPSGRVVLACADDYQWQRAEVWQRLGLVEKCSGAPHVAHEATPMPRRRPESAELRTGTWRQCAVIEAVAAFDVEAKQPDSRCDVRWTRTTRYC